MKKFIDEMIRVGHFSKMRPREVGIFNVNGTYGQYQIKIGPKNRGTSKRAIEINGKIHHLFLTKKKIEPMPTHEDINNNMRGTVIMNDITIHLFDEKGDGHAVKIRPDKDIHAHDLINLAGDNGKKLLREFETSGKLANETYRIVQRDILKTG